MHKRADKLCALCLDVADDDIALADHSDRSRVHWIIGLTLEDDILTRPTQRYLKASTRAAFIREVCADDRKREVARQPCCPLLPSFGLGLHLSSQVAPGAIEPH